MAEENKEVKHTKEHKKPDVAATPPAGAVVTAPDGTAVVVKKKKLKKNVATGIVHIQATFNNTIITVSDVQGNVLCWGTSGAKGFKGSKKGTPFAAQLASETACRKAAAEFGMKTVTVYVRGPGAGRESALRAISHAGLRVSSIRDLTPIPHNGCRPPKRRRI